MVRPKHPLARRGLEPDEGKLSSPVLSLDISSDLAEALRLPEDERLSRLQPELATRLYQKGLLSFGKVRELAALSKWAFHELLSQEGIERSYDEDELEDDLATLEALG